MEFSIDRNSENNKSALFDGASQSIIIKSSESIDSVHGRDRTFSFWMNPDNSSYSYMINRNANGNPQWAYIHSLSGNNFIVCGLLSFK